METNIIKRRIYLEPKYLDKNIMSHLLRTIEKKTIGEIDKELWLYYFSESNSKNFT